MQTLDYLQAAKRKIGAEKNAEIARRLGLSRAAMTKYYNGERIIDDYTAAQVAEILGVDPLTVIAQANAEREKDTTRAAYWTRIASKAAMTMGYVALPFVVLYLTGDTENAMYSIAWIGAIGSNTDYGVLLSSAAAMLFAFPQLQALCRPPSGWRMLRPS